MDAVAAADAGRELVLLGSRLQRREDPICARDQQVRRPRQLDRETGV